MKQNKNLASTVITDNVRVSTAAIYYDEWFGERWQIETFIFSKDERVKTSQIKIHGNVSCEDYVINSKGKTINDAIKIHNYISDNLFKKLGND